MQPTIVVQYCERPADAQGGGRRDGFSRTLMSLQCLVSRGFQLVVVKPHTVGADAWIKSETRKFGVRNVRLVTVTPEVYKNSAMTVCEVERCLPGFGGAFLVCQGELKIDPMGLMWAQPRGDGWMVYKDLVRICDYDLLSARTSRVIPGADLDKSGFMGVCGFRSFRVFEEAVLDLEIRGEEKASLFDVVNELRQSNREIYVHRVPVLRPAGIHRPQSVEGSRRVVNLGLKRTG